MAVTTTNRKAGPFIGNDVTTVFPFDFKVFTTADLYVLVEDLAGTLTLLVLGTDYTAVLNGDQDVSPGGSVTLTAALATGYRMTITSDVLELQQVILTNLGGFFPGVLNDVFDRLTILIQQLQQGVDQSIKFGLTDDLSTVDLPPAVNRANKFLYFGSDGAISLIATAPGGGGLVAQFAGVLAGTQDGVNAVFTITNGGVPLGKAPINDNSLFAWRNFDLIPGVGYSLGPTAGQLTFTTAPQPEDNLFAKGTFIP